jgi:hypothetical protein
MRRLTGLGLAVVVGMGLLMVALVVVVLIDRKPVPQIEPSLPQPLPVVSLPQSGAANKVEGEQQYCHETVSGLCFPWPNPFIGTCAGAINTAPCVVPTPTPTPAPQWKYFGRINEYPTHSSTPKTMTYIQGPTATARDDGSVAIVVNAGPCCAGPWEATFAAIYPGDASSPYWLPIYGGNNWGANPELQENEIGFMSLARLPWGWVLAGAKTNHATCADRIRLGVIELDNDFNITRPWRDWIPALSGARCTGKLGGNGWTSSILRVDGHWYVYLYDDTTSAKPDIYRVEILGADTFSYGDRTSGLTGETVGSRWLDDCAVSSAGRITCLTSTWPDSLPAGQVAFIQEVVSSDGINFSPSGRVWRDPDGLHLWDAGYLRTSTGARLEPVVIVGTTAPVKPMAADLGEWHLAWFADSLVNMPASWGTPITGQPPAPPEPPQNEPLHTYVFDTVEGVNYGRTQLTLHCGHLPCSVDIRFNNDRLSPQHIDLEPEGKWQVNSIFPFKVFAGAGPQWEFRAVVTGTHIRAWSGQVRCAQKIVDQCEFSVVTPRSAVKE